MKSRYYKKPFLNKEQRTIAKIIARDFSNQVYFNWDDIRSKRELIQNSYFFERVNRIDESIPLVIFDEIHKYRNWKNKLSQRSL